MIHKRKGEYKGRDVSAGEYYVTHSISASDIVIYGICHKLNRPIIDDYETVYVRID